MKVSKIETIKIVPVITIQAYMQQTPEGNLMDNTLVEVIEDDPEKALAKAKKLFPDKKFFRIYQYLEKEILK